jgi:hypothetical protein
MAEQQQTRIIKVPAALGQWIAVNVEFEAMLCVSPTPTPVLAVGHCVGDAAASGSPGHFFGRAPTKPHPLDLGPWGAT